MVSGSIFKIRLSEFHWKVGKSIGKGSTRMKAKTQPPKPGYPRYANRQYVLMCCEKTGMFYLNYGGERQVE